MIRSAIRLARVHLFEPREKVLWKPDIRLRRSMTGSKVWRGESAKPGLFYRVTLRVGGKDYTRILTVLEDIWRE
jgi:hypothetical protein